MLWTITSDDKSFPRGLRFGNAADVTRTIGFVNNETVAMVSYQFTPGAATKTIVTKLDAHIGKVLNEKPINELQGYPYLFVAGDGDIVVTQDRHIEVLDENLEVVVQRDLAQGSIDGMTLDGRYMIWGNPEIAGRKTVLLNAKTLEDSGMSFATPASQGATENVALFNAANGFGKRNVASISTAENDGVSKVIYTSDDIGASLNLISADRVLIISGDKVTVLTVDGRLLWSKRFKGEDITFAGVSRVGSRFAIVVTKRWPVFFWNISKEKVEIFEGSLMKPVSEIVLKDKPYPVWTALSADGKKFLSGSSGQIALYEVN